VGIGEAPSVTAFFPGLPWLTRAVELVTPSRTFAEILTVNAIALAASVAVYGATRAWRDVAIARRAVVLMALFPSSLFLWPDYTEGIFIALSAGALWADRRDEKWLTTLLLAGVAATRPGVVEVGQPAPSEGPRPRRGGRRRRVRGLRRSPRIVPVAVRGLVPAGRGGRCAALRSVSEQHEPVPPLRLAGLLDRQ
jgi:hypothetical protein